MPEPDGSRKGGKPLPLRPTTDDGEIRLEPPRVEPLTGAHEAEAVELLAALFAVAARRRQAEKSRVRKAA